MKTTAMGKRAVKLLKSTFADWMEDNALRLSAALAYYSIFSIAPLLIIAISVAGLVLGPDAVSGHLKVQLEGYLGAKAAETVQSMVQSASKPSESWLGTIVGFATLLLGASGVFGQLKDALNTIWEVKAAPGSGIWRLVRDRLLNFGMVLVIGFLLLTSLVLTAVLTALSGYLESLLGIPAAVGGVFGFIVSLAVVTALLAVIFKVLPDARIEWRNVWIGAFVTGLLFELGKFGLGFYLGREGTASGFGAAGSVVLLLLWVYYASCILLFGAEFTQVYAREHGHEIQPARGAVSVTAGFRAQQGLVPAKEAPPQAPAVPPELIEVTAPPPGRSPLGGLLTTLVGSFILGLIARRRPDVEEKPLARISGGFADLGHQATGKMAKWGQHIGGKLSRLFRREG
jgi:membrane protein